MCALFEEVLGTTGVRPDDSFFSAGGDSIIALRLRASALARGVAIELGDLYTLQTPRALAAHLDLMADIPTSEAPTPVGRLALLTATDIDALPDDVVDAYPIGARQAGQLFDSAYQTDVNMHCDIFTFRLRAPYHHDAMASAVERVVARHEILRTSFDFTRFSQPMQLVHETGSPRLSLTDLRSLSPADQDATLVEWRQRETTTPYDWARPPLVRFAVHQLSDTEFQFSMGFHDALLDGWSESALVTEILTDYWALLGGASPAVKEPPALRFADYVAAEQRILASERAREFWVTELSDVEPTLLPRLATGSGDGRTGFLSVDVPADLSARLDELAAANRVSLKHVLLAVHARVLALLTGRTDVVLGVESNGRVEGPGGAEVLGVHLNTVPYRLYTSDLPWTKLIDSALAKETTLLDVRAFPYADVQRIAGVPDLTDISFNYTHFHGYRRLAATGITVLDAKAHLQTNCTLRTEFNKDPFSKLLTLDLQANLERVAEPQLRQIADAYRHALEHLVTAPDQVPANRDLLGEERWRALLAEARGPVREHQDSGFLELFRRSVTEHPHLAAAVCGDDALTYGDLANWVDRLAGWLNAFGVDKGAVVGLRAGRDLDHLVAVMAIMRAGAVYLPLPAGPPLRVASMVRRTEAVLVLHDRAAKDVVWEAVDGTTTATIELADALAAARTHAPYRAPLPGGDDSAYIIVTSGSTGEPKGALLRHDGMLNHVQAKIDVLGLTSADRVSQDAAATFDVSLWQWFAPLAVGGTTVIYPDEVAQDPPTLLRAVARDAVTVLEVSPSVLSVFCAELDHYGVGAYAPFRLRWVASSGETLKPRTANEFRRLLPSVRLMNMWGITETSDDCTHYELTTDADERAPSVPIGGPIANSAVYVLDAHGEPVPVGTPGELYVGGVCVGAGYVNDADRTAAAFLPDPFTPGAVLYKTGDRGRRLADGGFEFLGRLDNQLKIRGQRVELGEVEQAFANVEAVRESAVVARTDNRLAAFFVASVDLSTMVLRKALGAVLPRYAVPDFLVRLDELPRTPHGKVDTKALRALEVSVPAEVETSDTATETAILEIIGSVLQTSVSDPTTDFFELGGHSLHATQVMARLRDRFGIDLPLRLLFEHRTARGLARCVDTAGASLTSQRIPDRPAGMTQFPLALNQASLWFPQQVDPDDRAYENTSLLRISGRLDVGALRAAVDTLARRHEALRLRFSSAAGVPYQEPDPNRALELEVIPPSAVPDDLPAYLREHGAGLDLANGPLARARLWQVSSVEHVLEWTIHQIVSDGWSSNVVMREIRQAYLAHSAGWTPDLPELTAQYVDYARWQEEFLATGAQTGFWRSYLDGYEGELALSTDFPRTDDRARAAGSATRRWDRTAAERLREFAAARQATPFMLGHAATAVLMAKLGQQSDIVLGAVVAGRTVPGTENLIGSFANTLPLRYTVDFADTPHDLLGSVTRSALRGLENQLLPFGRIVETSGVGRTPGVPPLVQVLVTFDNFPLDMSSLPGLSSTLTQVPAATSQFDLLFRFVEDDGLTLTVQYDATLFTEETIERLLEAMTAVLNFFVSRPDEPLSSAALVRPSDLATLDGLWRSLTGTEFDPDTVLESPSCTEFLDLVEKRGLLTALLLAL
jgi:amino acid adenylation domain-containing protein